MTWNDELNGWIMADYLQLPDVYMIFYCFPKGLFVDDEDRFGIVSALLARYTFEGYT